MNNFVIGISGVARSGKDTFASLLEAEIVKYSSKEVKRRALAYQLKKDINDRLLSRFNIQAFTSDDNEKKIIRPFLVEYGKEKRLETKGQYWTSKVQEEIDISNDCIFIITDIRYAIYESDEYQWIRKNNGILVHVSRYNGSIKNLILPPNEDEEFNDPILESLSDFKVVWPSTDNEETLNVFVRDFFRLYGRRIID